MQLGLRGKVLLMLLAPLAAFAPVTVFVIHQGVGSEVVREIDARGAAIVKQAASLVLDDVLTGEQFATERKLRDVQQSESSILYLFVTNANGELKAHTFHGGFPIDLLRTAGPAREFNRPVHVKLGSVMAHDFAAPILEGIGGQVHVGVSAEAAHRISFRVLLRLTLIGVAVVAVGVALAVALSNRIVKRLARLAEATSAIGAGSLNLRIDDTVDDEVGSLGNSFNVMASRLRAAQDERERVFFELAQSEKLVAIGRLAAGVAHEISNPLSGVTHCLDNLILDDSNPQKRHEYYGLMKDGVARSHRVVRGLVNYARQHDLEIRSVQMVELIDNVAQLLSSTFQKLHVSFEHYHGQTLPEIAADPHLLEQVMMNLLLNAAESMQEGGTIEVETSLNGDYCSSRVMDRGCGIDQQAVNRIFDPFYTTKGGSKGTGLGLSVSLGIVQRHNGKINVCARPGGGSIFEVLLPLGGAQEAVISAAGVPT
jgi:signal transduction histidine kinase